MSIGFYTMRYWDAERHAIAQAELNYKPRVSSEPYDKELKDAYQAGWLESKDGWNAEVLAAMPEKERKRAEKQLELRFCFWRRERL